MDKIGIRRFLNDQGYSNDDITYDNGSVKLQGRNFAYATPEADGSTYGNQIDLKNALNSYNNAGLLSNITNKVNTSPPKFEAPKPFSYDPNSDVQYQNALKSAQANAQTAGNNAMVQMGARGIGNSSITSDRVAQIGQNEMGKVTRDVLPQLLNQAYTRYLNDANMQRQATMDNYNVGQDQLKNLNGLLDTTNKLGQQDIKNANDAEDRRYAIQDINISRAKDLESRYGVKVNPTEDYSQSLAQVEGLKPITQQIAERAARAEEEKKAWAIVETLGYVPSEVSDILGIPAGTPTQAAKIQNGQLAVQQRTAATNATKATQPKTLTLAQQKAQTKEEQTKVDNDSYAEFTSEFPQMESYEEAVAYIDSYGNTISSALRSKMLKEAQDQFL